MLCTIAVIILIAWMLGIVGMYTIGTSVYELLVVPVVLSSDCRAAAAQWYSGVESTRTNVSRLDMWDKNEHNRNVDQAKGKVKQAAGTLSGVDDLKAESQLRFRGTVTTRTI